MTPISWKRFQLWHALKCSAPSSGGKIATMFYHAEIIARLLNVRPNQVDATIRLLDEGNTGFFATPRQE